MPPPDWTHLINGAGHQTTFFSIYLFRPYVCQVSTCIFWRGKMCSQFSLLLYFSWHVTYKHFCWFCCVRLLHSVKCESGCLCQLLIMLGTVWFLVCCCHSVWNAWCRTATFTDPKRKLPTVNVQNIAAYFLYLHAPMKTLNATVKSYIVHHVLLLMVQVHWPCCTISSTGHFSYWYGTPSS